jgi:hypothetical protein
VLMVSRTAASRSRRSPRRRPSESSRRSRSGVRLAGYQARSSRSPRPHRDQVGKAVAR